MDAKENLYNFQMKRFDIFKAQDFENGDFDVFFEIGEKKLYADKYVLAPISSTFKAMLSKRWINSESIKITGHTFEDFKEFLTFLYSGECKLTTDNISVMIDLAEFYDISIFKQYCEEFISKITVDLSNFLLFLEISEKYSLPKLKEPINKFFSYQFVKVLESDAFLKLSKSTVKKIIESNQSSVYNEEIFQAIVKWGNHQISKKEVIPKDENKYVNEALKNELSDFLPLIKYSSMKMDFLIKTVIKSRLFSCDEISDMLSENREKIYVRIINNSGKKAEGFLQCTGEEKNKIIEAIKAQKDQSCRGMATTYWPAGLKIPPTPSLLKQKDVVPLYFVYDRNGDIAIRYRFGVFDTDYLLAEMKDIDDAFYNSSDCKIEFYRDC